MYGMIIFGTPSVRFTVLQLLIEPFVGVLGILFVHGSYGCVTEASELIVQVEDAPAFPCMRVDDITANLSCTSCVNFFAAGI